MKFKTGIAFLSAVVLAVFMVPQQAVSADNDDRWEQKNLRSEYHSMTITRVYDGLENPWGVAFMPDGSYLVTERAGKLKHISDGSSREISGIPSDLMARGQGGLLDVSLHPDYEENGWIYLSYSKSNGNGQTALAVIRARIDGSSLTDVEEIFIQDRFSQPGRHYGSRFAWMLDGTLIFSIGDRGNEPPRAQAKDDHAGTVIRINYDGSVPEDNPFYGHDDALPEIYAYGSRNIQGMIVDPVTGEIWATEHGPRGGDELNMIEAGKNYGWPTVTLGRDYRTEGTFPGSEARSKEGMVDPVHEFLPTLAPSGLALITTDTFPRWNGNLIAGGLRPERALRLLIEDHTVIHEEELFLQVVGRIRDVREGPNGNIYLLNDEPNGGLFRVSRN